MIKTLKKILKIFVGIFIVFLLITGVLTAVIYKNPTLVEELGKTNLETNINTSKTKAIETTEQTDNVTILGLIWRFILILIALSIFTVMIKYINKEIINQKRDQK